MFKRSIVPVIILFSSLAAAQPPTGAWEWQHRRDHIEDGTWVPLPPTSLGLLEQGANAVCVLMHRDGTGVTATHFHVTPYDMNSFERDEWAPIIPQPQKPSFWKRFMEILGDDGYDGRNRWR